MVTYSPLSFLSVTERVLCSIASIVAVTVCVSPTMVLLCAIAVLAHGSTRAAAVSAVTKSRFICPPCSSIPSLLRTLLRQSVFLELLHHRLGQALHEAADVLGVGRLADAGPQ